MDKRRRWDGEYDNAQLSTGAPPMRLTRLPPAEIPPIAEGRMPQRPTKAFALFE
jgi:hypothetical protein